MIINDINTEHDFLVGKLYSDLFGCDIRVMIWGADLEYADKCAEYFNKMPAELISELKKYTLRYCEDFRQFFDEENPEVPENVTENQIFDYVSHQLLIIKEPKDANKIAFSMEFNCAWEEEHGMEWAVNDGRILYVGEFTDIGPWRSEEYYKRTGLNYVFGTKCID